MTSTTRTSNIMSTLLLSHHPLTLFLWHLPVHQSLRFFFSTWPLERFYDNASPASLPSSVIYLLGSILCPPSEALRFGSLSSSGNGQSLRSALCTTSNQLARVSKTKCRYRYSAWSPPTRTTSLMFRFGIPFLECQLRPVTHRTIRVPKNWTFTVLLFHWQDSEFTLPVHSFSGSQLCTKS